MLVLIRRRLRSIALAIATILCCLSLHLTARSAAPAFVPVCQSGTANSTVAALLAVAGTSDCRQAQETLQTMTELDLSDRHITDLGPLASFSQLQRLYLSQNQITDLSPLSTLTHLEALYLPSNQVRDLAAIAHLPQLHTLYLDSNQIQDLTPLTELRSLTILYANSNQILNLTPLTGLTALTELYLANNQITNLQALQPLHQIHHLNLGYNRITQVIPLATLTQLVELDLSHNRITRIDPLSPLEQLTRLDLRQNSVRPKTCPVYPATICAFSDDAADLYRQGEQQLDRGDYPAALNSFQTALETYRQVGDRLRESDALDRLGNVYDALDQYANALDYYQQGEAIRQAIGDRQGEGDTQIYLGVTYLRLGQTDKAIAALRSAWDITQTLNPEDISWQRPDSRDGILLSSLSLAYSQSGENDAALRYAKQSLASYRRISDCQGEATALNRVGAAYQAVGDLEKARLYLEKALDLSQRQSDRSNQAHSLHNLGSLAASLGDPTNALHRYEQALELRRTLEDSAGEGETLNAMGSLLLAQGDPTAAVAALQTAVSRWESLRPGLTDENKISIAETQAQTYRLLQAALIARDDITAALEISERGRARAFTELLGHRLALQGKPLPPHQLQPPTSDQIRQIAQAQNATLVEYSLGISELYTWVIAPSGQIHFHRQPSPNSDLSRQVMDNRLALGIPRRGAATIQVSLAPDRPDSLRQLYQELIAPIADWLPADPDAAVVIIPQGDLFLVPFPALQDDDGGYLIDHHPLRFAPAISLLTTSSAPRPLTIGRDLALVVGNPTMPTDPDTGSPLPPLSGAQQEAQAIAPLLNTQPLLGSAATKAAVVPQMEQAAIAHFATHGLLDDFGTGIPGALALAPTDTDSGFLTAAEIFTLPLQARLVVLSACDTGLGKITGDGVVGLSRSFLTAGVESLVVSLWSVPDEPTALLMAEFYRQLQQQPDRAVALQQAMLVTRDRYPQPAKWAAFALFGLTGT